MDGRETPKASFIPAQGIWGVALGWYESDLRPEGGAPHRTDYRPQRVRKEYIWNDIGKAFNANDTAGSDEFCLVPELVLYPGRLA